MRSTIPFGKSVEDHGGVDQSGNQAAENNDEDDVAEWSTQTEPPKSEYINQEPEHGYAAPAMTAVETALVMAPPMLPAIPAAPPKIACVMLGIKSMLMMNAIKTIVHGMRFASHISIE